LVLLLALLVLLSAPMLVPLLVENLGSVLLEPPWGGRLELKLQWAKRQLGKQ